MDQKGELLRFGILDRTFAIAFDDKRLEDGLLSRFGAFSQRTPAGGFGGDVPCFELRTSGQPGSTGLYGRDSAGGAELLLGFESVTEEVLEAVVNKVIFALSLAFAPECFFLHSGAVSFGRSGILIPGNSHSGKSSLVAELVRAGGEFFTDDCALLDADGRLHPNRTPMALRLGDARSRLTAGQIGGKQGAEPAEVRLILKTQFVPGESWRPRVLPAGDAAFFVLQNFFFFPFVNRFPEISMRFASDLASRAVCVESPRGEASEVVEWMLGPEGVLDAA